MTGGMPMRMMMQAFAKRKCVSLDVLRFLIDGARVNAEDTPRTLEMEDGDQIEVMFEFGYGPPGTRAETLTEQSITLKLRDQSGVEMFFKVKKGTAMRKLMKRFAELKGVAVGVLYILLDGVRLQAEDTQVAGNGGWGPHRRVD